MEDKAIWLASSDGCFSIQSVWNLWRTQHPKVQWAKLLWFKHHIPRISTIVWMAIHNRPNTLDRLAIFGVRDNSRCVLCEKDDEDHNHLFFDCPFSFRIWSTTKTKCNVTWPIMHWNHLVNWLAAQLSGSSLAITICKLVFTCSIYCIWQERNCRIFQTTKSNEVAIVRKIQELVRCRVLSITNFKADCSNNWFLQEWALPSSIIKSGNG